MTQFFSVLSVTLFVFGSFAYAKEDGRGYHGDELGSEIRPDGDDWTLTSEEAVKITNLCFAEGSKQHQSLLKRLALQIGYPQSTSQYSATYSGMGMSYLGRGAGQHSRSLIEARGYYHVTIRSLIRPAYAFSGNLIWTRNGLMGNRLSVTKSFQVDEKDLPYKNHVIYNLAEQFERNWSSAALIFPKEALPEIATDKVIKEEVTDSFGDVLKTIYHLNKPYVTRPEGMHPAYELFNVNGKKTEYTLNLEEYYQCLRDGIQPRADQSH